MDYSGISQSAVAGKIQKRLLRLPHLVFAALALVAAHALSILLAGKHATAASYLFLAAAPFLATIACLWRGMVCFGITRAKWMLVSIGFLFWSVGIALTARQDLLLHTTQSVALLEDFLFFIYGVPVLVALSVTARDQNLGPILLLDVLQALLAIVLVYFILFNEFPFAREIAHPVPLTLLTRIYNIENLALAVAAVFSLMARPQGEEKTFYGILCAFTISYAVAAAIYNYASTYWNVNAGTLFDLLIDLPWLILVVPIVGIAIRRTDQSLKAGSNPITLFVNNASPILFTLAVLALGAYLTTKNLYLGVAVTCVALVVYCLRATMLQSWYFGTQLALYEANNKLHELSLRDPLTGISNRGGFERALKFECERAERTSEPLSLLMIDVDCFKPLNDTYGHVYGDDCLIRVAKELERNLNRSSDTVARYGGEEFAVLLPKTDIENAVHVAEKLRNAVAELLIPNAAGIGNFVSVSIGLAAYDCAEKNSFVHSADTALYAAKRNGRNRYEIAASSLKQMSQ